MPGDQSLETPLRGEPRLVVRKPGVKTVYRPESEKVELQHFYRALDFLAERKAEIRHERCMAPS